MGIASQRLAAFAGREQHGGVNVFSVADLGWYAVAGISP